MKIDTLINELDDVVKLLNFTLTNKANQELKVLSIQKAIDKTKEVGFELGLIRYGNYKRERENKNKSKEKNNK